MTKKANLTPKMLHGNQEGIYIFFPWLYYKTDLSTFHIQLRLFKAALAPVLFLKTNFLRQYHVLLQELGIQ